MPHRYHQLAFTKAVKTAQEANGARRAYARMEHVPQVVGDRLGEDEAGFIAARDSFYMATVNSEGWPYIQHRGGAPGFVKIVDDKTLAFGDYPGNRQHISLGNTREKDRAAFIFMDYPNRARLKLFGRLEAVALDAHAGLKKALEKDVADALSPPPEFAWLVHVEAVDWNCPKYITPRFSADVVRPMVEKLEARVRELEDRLRALGELV